MEQDVMGSKGFIIEVGIYEVKGALFASILGRTRIERMESVSIKDGETAAAIEKLIADFPSDATITLILPGHLFMVRTVQLPFTDRKRIRKALPYEMDGLLPFPIEELLIDSLSSTHSESGSRVMAVAIPAKLLQHYLSLFPEGRKPSIAIPDFVSLLSLGINIKGEDGIYGIVEMEEGKTSMVLIQNGRPVLARSISATDGFPSVHETIRATIKGFLDAGQKITRLYITGSKATTDFPPIEGVEQIVPLPPIIKDISLKEKPSFVTVAGGARAAIEFPWFNMLGLSSEAERFEKGLKSLSIGAAILLVIGTGDLYLHSRTGAQRYSSLKAESRKVFLSVMPDVKKVVKEDAQMKDALNKEKGTLEALTGKPAPSYLPPIKGIEKIVSDHPEIRVREASFEGFGVTIQGDGSSIDAEGLKKIFSGIEGAREARVEEVTQGVEPNSYRFRIRVELRS